MSIFNPIMKRIFIVLFLSHFALNAQVSINSSAMPSSGDTLRFSEGVLDTAILLNYQNPGPNQVWNFNSLVPLRQGVSEFLNSNQTPYTAIPQRIGEKLADTVSLGGVNLYDVYNFYNNSTSEYALEYRGASIPTGLSFPFPSVFKIDDPYIDKDEVYQFPLNYLDRDSSTYNYVFSSPLPTILNAYYGSRGYRINEADAWGNLTTPFGSFNCIRVVTDIVGYDTVQFDTTGFGINSHRREYKWLSPNVEIPVLTINGIVVGGVFVPSTVQYRDSVRPGIPNLFSPIALFSADNTNGIVRDTFNITNATISLTTPNYRWDIQPSNFQYVNNTTATSQDISIVFNQTGLYNVQLIADNGNGSDTLLILDYIQINNPINSRIPTAAFSSFIQNLMVGDSLNFINRSINDTASLWNISPSTYSYVNNTDSLSRNPFISFLDSGFYTISLIAFNSFGSDTLTRVNYIKVDRLTSLKENSFSENLKLYPNPVKSGNTLFLSKNNDFNIENAELFSLTGKLISNIRFQNLGKEYLLEIENNVPSSIYYIVIKDKKANYIQKIIIQ